MLPDAIRPGYRIGKTPVLGLTSRVSPGQKDCLNDVAGLGRNFCGPQLILKQEFLMDQPADVRQQASPFVVWHEEHPSSTHSAHVNILTTREGLQLVMFNTVITGASRGIGLAAAVELARAGHRVVATMRNPAGSPELGEQAAKE